MIYYNPPTPLLVPLSSCELLSVVSEHPSPFWGPWQGPTCKFYLVPSETVKILTDHFHSLNSKAY